MEDEGIENNIYGQTLRGSKQCTHTTQAEQDEIDEKARKKAMKNLVDSWQERLQLISVITTFFASVEAGMLVNTRPVSSDDQGNGLLKASNASLLGALIMHVYAAGLSFLAAFLLIRYKLKEATRQELIAEGVKVAMSPLGGSLRVRNKENDIESIDGRRAFTIAEEQPTKTPVQARQPTMGSIPEPPILARNPHLEQVGLFWFRNVSSHLLSKFHTLCVTFAVIGFVLATAGIVLYAWAIQPREVYIFATACLAAAVLAMGTLAM
ncbi:hypothetical protein BKA82DRAFT_121246 [Pisolithus tinctorius]|uniref:Uncharacterized protein n=1 Tax=Pisolithus tinctorius Marx 270 TaxID=870435 RepID=A0A0C3JXM3_PISTI|nr:hypothetical protein BKA82DRAFT_121246 [Pisolithus tinctorius]KIO13873.1 hypothetical protein M404DRAFT_121246 [Pisolithus tinctorius Marx 270]